MPLLSSVARFFGIQLSYSILVKMTLTTSKKSSFNEVSGIHGTFLSPFGYEVINLFGLKSLIFKYYWLNHQ